MEKTSLEEIIEGLQLIHQAEPDAQLSAEHDELWVGDINKHSDEVKQKLADLGWSVGHSGIDAFHRYV